MRRFNRALLVLCATLLVGLQSGLARAAPEVGWWWNPNESGRGFFIEMKGNQLFMAGYFYADDGRGTWAISGGAVTDLNNYTGRLATISGGQTLVGSYIFPTNYQDLGVIDLHFTDDTHGTLTWPGGSIQIERQIFGGGSASFQPSGWWWNPNESGRGFSIEVQGSTLDVVAFMYDGNGNPVWYISSGPMSSTTHYSGRLDQIGGGQTMSGSYKMPTTDVAVGSITIDFASLQSGTITLSDVVPAGASTLKSEVVIPIEPQLSDPPLTDVAPEWSGVYDGTLVYDPPGADALTITATGDVKWIDVTSVPDNAIVFPPTATPARAYVVSEGNAMLHVTGIATFPGAGQGLVCSISGDATVELATVFDNSYLQFEADGVMTGQIATGAPFSFPVTATCSTPSGAINFNSQYLVQITYPVSGRHRYNHSEGTDPLHTIAQNVMAGATWSFSGIPAP
jgi:hypothetical protein